MTIIGITGNFGAGKSTVAKIFCQHRFSVIDADEIGHQQIKSNPEIKSKLIKNFGREILGSNGNISRKKLGDVVFKNVRKIRKINSILHPSIIKEIKAAIREIEKKQRHDVNIAIDAPLLIEAGMHDMVDKIVVVKTGHDRVFRRSRNFSKPQIENILKMQFPLKEKLKYADFVIDNNGDLMNLKNQVKKIIGNIK